MTKMQAQIKFSVEDYQYLPESETKRYELLGGDLVLTPSPTCISPLLLSCSNA